MPGTSPTLARSQAVTEPPRASALTCTTLAPHVCVSVLTRRCTPSSAAPHTRARRRIPCTAPLTHSCKHTRHARDTHPLAPCPRPA